MTLDQSTLSSNCNSIMSNLNDNLLIEILMRLPCRCAFRCTAVSKRWRNLISTRYFILRFTTHHHHQHDDSPLPTTLVFRFDYFHCYMHPETTKNGVYKSTHSISDHPMIKSRGFRLLEFIHNLPSENVGSTTIVAGCDDLLIARDGSTFPSVYFVCNPLTRKWVKLPPALRFHTEDRTVVGLVTDRDSEEEGYRSECKQLCWLRLVCITELSGHGFCDNFIVEVFSSETGEWTSRTMSISLGGFGSSRSMGTVIANKRKLHWLRGQSTIVFDPFNDTASHFHTIKSPTGVHSRVPLNCLGFCNNHLLVSQVSREEADSKLMVWELSNHYDNTEEWLLKHRICLKHLVFVNEDSFKRLTFSSEVIAFHPSDADIVYLKDHDQMVMCDMKSRTLKVVNEGMLGPSIHIRRILVYPLTHPWWPTSVMPLLAADRPISVLY